MVLASQLRSGMAIVFEGQTYRVIAADYHPGQGKMGASATRICRISRLQRSATTASVVNSNCRTWLSKKRA
jgi:translation elongation factor P/translation initiation factor 5A